MKNLLSIALALIGILSASSQDFLTKFTTSKTGNISIYFKAAEPNTTVSITVNDGEPTTANIAKANYSTAIKVALPSQESNTVTVSAKGITLFNYGNGKMSNIEFGPQASTINEVRVNNNNFSSLSFVDQLPALTYLVAGGNPDITSVAINLPNLQKLELDNSPSVTSLTLNTPELNLLKLNKSKITSLDLSGTKMADLTLAGDSLLKTVNFGNITTLKNVSITSNPAIESLSFKNMPELLKVILTGCPALSDVTLENLPQMWQFNAPDANLSSIDFVNCPFPKGDITLSGNNFETFAPNTPGVWTMTINNFKAKTVDLSALPLLNTLKATGGDIEKIIFHKESLDSAMKNLDVKNNNFTLINLPPRGKNVNTALNYYAPQKVMPTIPDVITVNTPVDLSAWVFGQSLEGNVASQIVWETSLEEILQEGEDYTVENGVYTFLKARDEQVRAIISNTAFPDFKITQSGNNTYDYRLITNYATLEGASVGIENVSADGNLSVSVSGSTLYITSDSNVEVYNIEGVLIYQGVATTISLNKGVYIIRSGANVAKIII